MERSIIYIYTRRFDQVGARAFDPKGQGGCDDEVQVGVALR